MGTQQQQRFRFTRLEAQLLGTGASKNSLIFGGPISATWSTAWIGSNFKAESIWLFSSKPWQPSYPKTAGELMFIPQNMVIIGFDLSRSHHFGAQHLSHGEGRRPGASATKLHAGRKKSLDIHRIMDRKITLL